MPQISPINWILISLSFLIILSSLISYQNPPNGPQSNQINNNNILWNW